jgi:hypothetical protein
MNAIVRIALSRPYTFVVLALFLLIVGPLAALRTPADIFPDIRIPVIGVVWQYTGLPPDQMAGRITTPFERALTTTVNDIEHIVANSYNGIGIVKIFFQPNVDIQTANAQVTAISQTLIKAMPPGATPPLILNYNASTVPIIQVALSGEGLTEQNLADIGINQLRTPLVTVPGAAIPYPYGGKQRQVQIDLNPSALQARGLSGQDVANALAAQNLITPVGTQKIGLFEYMIQLNNSPLKMEDLGNLPIKTVNGAMVYVRDVADVRDGNPPQTNIVHVDGNRSVLMMVLKAGVISTLDIISGIKQKVIDVKPTLPEALHIGFIGDQSIFVQDAISNVAHEGIIAALLTSVMILLFLGSWRSTLIIATSIPLAVFGAIVMLSAIGETLNIMTLGGACTRGRNSRRRGNGDDREHQLSPRAGQGGPDRNPGRRQPDRGAGLCVAVVYLHRVRADVLSGGRGAVSVRADGGSGGVRHDLVVHPVAHAGADDGEVPAAAASASRRRRNATAVAQSAGAVSARLRGAVRAGARRLSGRPGAGAGAPSNLRDGFPRLRRGLVSACAVPRAEFLPVCRCRPNPDACPHPGRNPRREDRQRIRRHPEGDPQDHSAGRDRDHGRQYRHADQRHQHDLQQHRRDRRPGRRYPDQTEGRPQAHRRLCPGHARAAAAGVSRPQLCVPARRYHQPDSQFRRAGAD